ncbi:hypothetical protein [Sulfuricurvum sp.]|uniref:hypothetical protein n=1 Tax=Sulfuricurvum sp. TaxID=2025608 RepID=UPI002626B94F|nr:hypothetical protein [Sulfuricurvum sp.]MDD2781652.1 hypothetical protein [Sulfuricurvum sp.]
MIQYYLAFVLNTQFNIGILKLIFIAFVFTHSFILERRSTIGKFNLMLLGLLLYGSIGTLIYMIAHPHALDNITIPLRIRFTFIEIFFSIALYIYLQNKPIEYILRLLLIGVILNAIAGTIQFILEPFARIQMLFPEPSAAGYYYLFIFFIIYEKFRHGWPMIGSRYFMLIGLAIGSKAQYALLLAVGLLHYLSPRRLIIFLSILVTFTYLFRAEIMGIPAVKYNINVAEVYWEQGLSGLNSSNRIWNTYSTRLAAIEGSVRCISENPLGIGFGSYDDWFKTNMKNTGLINSEINDVLWGKKYATSKSNLLELFVATGIFGIALYIYIGRYFYRYRHEHGYIFKSFVMLTLASLFIELSPMFIYLTILWVLLEKELHNKLTEKTA